MFETNKTEEKLLKNLQLISEEISDLINIGNYENIRKLDNQRKEIIKSFTKKPSKSNIDKIKKIMEMNNTLIEKIQTNKLSLTKTYRKFLDVVAAYK